MPVQISQDGEGQRSHTREGRWEMKLFFMSYDVQICLKAGKHEESPK